MLNTVSAFPSALPRIASRACTTTRHASFTMLGMTCAELCPVQNCATAYGGITVPQEGK